LGDGGTENRARTPYSSISAAYIAATVASDPVTDVLLFVVCLELRPDCGYYCDICILIAEKVSAYKTTISVQHLPKLKA